MTGLEITDKIISELGGGKFRMDIKWEPELILAELPQYRSRAMIIAYNGSRDTAMSKVINPAWYQSWKTTINKADQDSDKCYLVVKDYPQMVRLDQHTDGHTFIGENEGGKSFRKIVSPEQASMYVRAGRLKPDTIGYVHIGSELRLYGNLLLEEFYNINIVQNPLDVPGFDIDTDRYPISVDLIPVMAGLYEFDMARKLGIIQDTKIDQSDSMELRAIKPE